MDLMRPFWKIHPCFEKYIEILEEIQSATKVIGALKAMFHIEISETE